MSTFLSLKPLSQPGKGFRFSVADIESKNWTEFLTIGYFNGDIFLHFESLEEFFNHLFEEKPRHVFCHFGGIFDFLFLLGHLFDFPQRYYVDAIIPRGSGILCFDVECAGITISFHDSSAILPFGLKAITESFGVSHTKKEWDHSKTTHVTPELIKYLKFDCVGLYESLEAFYAQAIIKKAGPKFTLASQAITVFRTFLSDALPGCPHGIDTFVRGAYAGGRTEIFKPIYRGNAKKPLKLYDVNSLYPAVMAENEFPGAFKGMTTKPKLEDMGFIECQVTVPDTYVPLLWVKAPKFTFPVGTFRGVWSTPELREAVKRGVKINKVYRGAMFHSAGRIFKEYVETLYSKRKASTDNVERTVLKLLLNSSYGRFAMNLEKESIEFDHGQEGVKPHAEIETKAGIMRLVKGTTRLQSYTHIGIGAFITAYARIKMLPLLERCQSELYYTDTDSLYTTMEFPNSQELGELKLEGESSDDACFLLPKTYSALGKTVMKGFDKRKIKKFTVDDFLAHLSGELSIMTFGEGVKMSRFKTAMRKGKFLNIEKDRGKAIKSTYDKRILFQNRNKWDSRALTLQ